MKSLIATACSTLDEFIRANENMKTKSLRSSGKATAGWLAHLLLSSTSIALFGWIMVWSGSRRIHLKLNRFIYEYGKWMRDHGQWKIRWNLQRHSIVGETPKSAVDCTNPTAKIIERRTFASRLHRHRPFNANEFIASINRNFEWQSHRQQCFARFHFGCLLTADIPLKAFISAQINTSAE